MDSVSNAISSALASHWINVQTEAQGDLTEYLAKNHLASYGGQWNRLARESRQRIELEVMPNVTNELERLKATQLHSTILLDLNRIALYAAYAKRFPNVPDYFNKLFAIYKNGRLPCGWIGSFEDWPQGTFVCY
jgi:hypothetical protein